MEVNIYKLKNGKAKGDFQLPLTDILVERIKEGKSVGLRKLKYVPGTNTFWAEDSSGDLQPQFIWFRDGKLTVPKADVVKNELLQIHPFFNKQYELHDKQAEAKRELEELKSRDKIIQILAEADTARLVATSTAIFGLQAIGWDDATAELQLRKYADKNPIKLSRELESKTYESKFLAHLAFGKGIVKYSPGKLAIVWNDTTEGEIMKLAKGENGGIKLGELLSKRTNETDVLLHAIMEKIEKIEVSIPESKTDDNEELKALKAELEAKNKELELVELRDQYKELYEVNLVPVRYKNDAEWIQKKIDEKLAE